jgi:hypothetical protein
MRLGPISAKELEALEPEFRRLNLAFEILEDKAALLEQESHWKRQSDEIAVGHAIGLPQFTPESFEPKFIFLEIEEPRTPDIQLELERILAGTDCSPGFEEPDFGVEEYFCPRCGFVSEKEEICPKHKEQLITREQRAERRNERERQLAMRALIAFGALLILALFYNYFIASGGFRARLF